MTLFSAKLKRERKFRGLLLLNQYVCKEDDFVGNRLASILWIRPGLRLVTAVPEVDDQEDNTGVRLVANRGWVGGESGSSDCPHRVP